MVLLRVYVLSSPCRLANEFLYSADSLKGTGFLLQADQLARTGHVPRTPMAFTGTFHEDAWPLLYVQNLLGGDRVHRTSCSKIVGD